MESLESIFRQAALSLALRQEADILTGCARCGRRLVGDGQPIAGATMVSRVDNPLIERAVCGECASDAPAMCELLGRG